jgi:hypothetical protein
MKEIELESQGNLWIYKVEGKEFGFKKLTWGEKNKVIAISQKLSPNGVLTFDMESFNVNLLLAALKKAPFAINRETLENYPDAKLIDTLHSIATQMNIADPIQIKNL